MHVEFDPSNVEWFHWLEPMDSSHLSASSSSSSSHSPLIVQYGGYNVFRGSPYQRGTGIGSVLRHLYRFLLPVGKEIAGAIGQEGLAAGNRVLSKVLEGNDLKHSLVSEGKSGLKNLLEKAANNLDAQKGGGFDFKRYNKSIDSPISEGGARIGKLRMHKSDINRLQSHLGPTMLLPTKPTKRSTAAKKKTKTNSRGKRLRFDALGSY